MQFFLCTSRKIRWVVHMHRRPDCVMSRKEDQQYQDPSFQGITPRQQLQDIFKNFRKKLKCVKLQKKCRHIFQKCLNFQDNFCILASYFTLLYKVEKCLQLQNNFHNLSFQMRTMKTRELLGQLRNSTQILNTVYLQILSILIVRCDFIITLFSSGKHDHHYYYYYYYYHIYAVIVR